VLTRNIDVLGPGTDWLAFYGAGRAYLDGRLGLIFDPTVFTAYLNTDFGWWLTQPLAFRPWVYPPSFLLLLVPFAMLSLAGSYLLFELASAATLLVALAVGSDRSEARWAVVSGCTGTACQVTLSIQHNTALASAFLPTVTIRARAEADIETFSSVACIVAVGSGGVVTISSNVNAPNCALVVPTSPNPQSVSISNGVNVGLDTIWTHGGYSAGTATVKLATPALTFAGNGSGSYMPGDPYASSPPNFPVPTNPQSVPAGCPSGTLSPGVYNPMSFQTGHNQCKDIDLTPACTISSEAIPPPRPSTFKMVQRSIATRAAAPPPVRGAAS
jgi:hypothetical protein